MGGPGRPLSNTALSHDHGTTGISLPNCTLLRPAALAGATDDIQTDKWTAVAALVIDKVGPIGPTLSITLERSVSGSGGSSYKAGPMPYHFRSGSITRPGSKKSKKISVVHSLTVLKGPPEYLKCGKTLWRGLRPDPR